MADVRMTTSTVITDPSTSTQQAGVNSSGELKVIVPTSIVPGTAATNLGKAEDAAHTSGDVGVLSLAVRQAANAPLSGSDLDYEPLQTDANGHLKVNLIDALPTGTNSVGDVRAITTSVTPGTSAAHLGKAEDAGHTTGDTGVMCLAVRNDSTTALATTDLDYIPLSTDSVGRLRVTDPNAGAGSPVSPTLLETTKASLAAGSATTTELRTTDLGGNTRKLTQIDVASSVPFKADIHTVINGAVTDNYAVVYGAAGGGTVQWRPPHKDYTSKVFSANAGFDGFEVLMTNLDSADAADVFCTFYYES